MNPATQMSSTSPDTLEVEIERILPGGVGLAHAGGRTIFVSLAAAGDVVRVQIDRIQGKVAFASIVEIIKPSPDRVEPPCPYFGRCGGCDFQQLTYESQLRAKVDIIRDCLRRIAGIEVSPEIQIHHSPRQWRYRARANWQFDASTKALGYFERGSHRVCDVAECAVLVPELQGALEELREIKDRLTERVFANIDATAGDNGTSLNPGFNERRSNHVNRKIGNETYSFNANTFFQTNHDLLEPLVECAIGEASGTTAIDLYCGVGLFTLPLARRFAQVVGIESSKNAAEFARRNLRNAQLFNARILTSSVADWIKSQSDSSAETDFLLLDPPRSGVEPGVIDQIRVLKPKRISYVSCDPATLSRDLKGLVGGGYSLDSVTAFDMFPQTHHVETIVRLS